MQTNSPLEMNSQYLEQNGYWYSEHSGIWYQKFYKDYAKMYYGWERVTSEDALEALELGRVPSDLEQQLGI